VEKRGRIGKKGVGDTLQGSDTQVKGIKSDSDSDSDEQKRSPGFLGKNRWVTPTVAVPGVTHPNDATAYLLTYLLTYFLQINDGDKEWMW